MTTKALTAGTLLLSFAFAAACAADPAEGNSSLSGGATGTPDTGTGDGETQATNTTDSGPGTSTSDATGTDASSESGSFFPEDVSETCGTVCDIWTPDDCPEGEKCTAVGCEVGGGTWDSNVCREVQGTGTIGDECMSTDGSWSSGNDTCEKGSMCWDPDLDTGVGTCVAFCTGSADTPVCPAGTNCALWDAVVICLPSCDPLAQDCEGNELCVPTPSESGFSCVLDASGGMAPYGTPCNYSNVCNKGLMCAAADLVPESQCASAAGCCSPFCSIAANEPCPGEGQSCQAIFDPQPPGFEDVGVCGISL